MAPFALDASGCPVLPLQTPVSAPVSTHFGPEIAYPPAMPPEESTRLALRCTPDFHRWACGLADHMSLNLTQAVVQGLIRIAEGSGYHHKIPTRYAPVNPGRSRRRRRPG